MMEEVEGQQIARIAVMPTSSEQCHHLQAVVILADIKEKMDSAGITLGTLKIAIEKDLTIPVASKYEIEIDGETHRWSGRGRTPAAFARYMEEQGITKEQLPKTI